MDVINKQLRDINAIRKMMEQSNKFISLSGLSGVIAGVAALAGAALARYKLENDYLNYEIESIWSPYFIGNLSYYSFYVLDAIAVMIVAFGAGIIPTISRAKKKKQSVFNPTAYRMFINLLIPIIAGGLFCFLLLNYSLFGLLAPCMLIFYGLGLINASHYTINDIRYLGYFEILLGLLNGLYPGMGIYFLAFGFGVMHIAYGLFIYFKYERD